MSCVHFKEGYKYQLTKTYSILTTIRPPERVATEWLVLDKDGRLTIFKGYAWDGASGPTLDTPSSKRPSLVHDAFFQLMRLGLLDRKWRQKVDELFRAMCLEDGMWGLRARIWFKIVRAFAGQAAEAESEPQEQCAPFGECACPLE